jgi:hypothetical protein
MHLNRRPAKIGSNISSRTERHGDDDVPAFDVPLEAIMLTQAELNALMQEPLTSIAWFNDRKDGLAEPLFKNIKHFSLTDKYEGCSVAIAVGLKERLFELEDCKLVKLKLAPCVGGLTELKITVQAKIDETNTALFEYLSKDCALEITFGSIDKKDAKQPELNLGVEAQAPKKRGRPRKATATGDALN